MHLVMHGMRHENQNKSKSDWNDTVRVNEPINDELIISNYRTSYPGKRTLYESYRQCLCLLFLSKSAVLVCLHGYRVFSLTWLASMQIYWNKRKRLHKKRSQFPEDWFGAPTWPPFHCFGTPLWPPWRHVKTLYRIDINLIHNTLINPTCS